MHNPKHIKVTKPTSIVENRASQYLLEINSDENVAYTKPLTCSG